MLKKCKQCGREFETYDKVHRGGRYRKPKRPHNSINCSRVCSEKYRAEENKRRWLELKQSKK